MNCICKKLEKNSKEYLVFGNWNTLAMRRDEDGEYSIVAIGDGEAEMKLNYCPRCGRKLSWDDWDDEEMI